MDINRRQSGQSADRVQTEYRRSFRTHLIPLHSHCPLTRAPVATSHTLSGHAVRRIDRHPPRTECRPSETAKRRLIHAFLRITAQDETRGDRSGSADQRLSRIYCGRSTDIFGSATFRFVHTKSALRRRTKRVRAVRSADGRPRLMGLTSRGSTVASPLLLIRGIRRRKMPSGGPDGIRSTKARPVISSHSFCRRRKAHSPSPAPPK